MEDLGNLHEFMVNALIRKEEKNCCKYLIIRVERMRKSLYKLKFLIYSRLIGVY